MGLAFRRYLSALFALLYLLAAGGETLQHAWADPVAAFPEAHVHGQGGDHDCPPPLHDELHCPSCKLSGQQTLPPSRSPSPAAVPSAPRVAIHRDEWAPAVRSHAPPASRAPPLG